MDDHKGEMIWAQPWGRCWNPDSKKDIKKNSAKIGNKFLKAKCRLDWQCRSPGSHRYRGDLYSFLVTTNSPGFHKMGDWLAVLRKSPSGLLPGKRTVAVQGSMSFLGFLLYSLWNKSLRLLVEGQQTHFL